MYVCVFGYVGMFEQCGACWAAGKEVAINGGQPLFRWMHSVFSDACFKVGHFKNSCKKKTEKKVTPSRPCAKRQGLAGMRGPRTSS